MRFDFTKGGIVNYSVSLYGDRIEDKYYFNGLDEAKRFYQEMIQKVRPKGTWITLRDVSGHDSVIIRTHCY